MWRRRPGFYTPELFVALFLNLLISLPRFTSCICRYVDITTLTVHHCNLFGLNTYRSMFPGNCWHGCWHVGDPLKRLWTDLPLSAIIIFVFVLVSIKMSEILTRISQSSGFLIFSYTRKCYRKHLVSILGWFYLNQLLARLQLWSYHLLEFWITWSAW